MPRLAWSWRCPNCGTRFYLDQDDFNRRAHWLVHGTICAGILGGILGGIFIVELGALTFLVGFFALLAATGVATLILMLRSKTVLTPSTASRRKQRYLRLGGMSGTVAFGTMFLQGIGSIPKQFYAFTFSLIFCCLILGLILGLIFFGLGYSAPKGS